MTAYRRLIGGRPVGQNNKPEQLPVKRFSCRTTKKHIGRRDVSFLIPEDIGGRKKHRRFTSVAIIVTIPVRPKSIGPSVIFPRWSYSWSSGSFKVISSIWRNDTLPPGCFHIPKWFWKPVFGISPQPTRRRVFFFFLSPYRQIDALFRVEFSILRTA